MCNITKIYRATCSKDELLLYSEYSGEWADGPEPIESSHHHRRQFWSVKRSHEKQVKMVRSRLYSKVFVNKNIELQRWSIWAGIQDWDEQRAAPPDAASGNSGRHSSSSCGSRLKSRDPADELMIGRERIAMRYGAAADRAPIVSVIDDWCGKVKGTTVNNGQTVWVSQSFFLALFRSYTPQARYNYGTFTVFVIGAAINGCNFVIDGNCNRLLRLPVDGCNTGGVNGKQGGYETDLCGQWRTDPGSNGSDV
ncbi:hypothetical protein B0H14DRAFT_2631835 [Mycena olivaceomarginata]|nr:hypothetical protein B0H14DRAFT_2631835 [Mycena olivaceomarginata]